MKKLLPLSFSLFLFSTSHATIINRPNIYTGGTIIDPAAVNSNETTIYTDYNGSINSTNIANNGIAYSNLSTSLQSFYTYRRPVLIYSSSTVVSVEAGINGVSGQVEIVFPDGSMRTDSAVGHIQCDITHVALLTGSAQSGIRTGAVANNTWYAVYAVKSQANSTDIIAVADSTLPLQANFSNLNTYFGANSWVYLGLIRYGDNNNVPNAILEFYQCGNFTKFINQTYTQGNDHTSGYMFEDAGSGASIGWAYSAGTGAAQIPDNIKIGIISSSINPSGFGESKLMENVNQQTTFDYRYSGGLSAFTYTSIAPVSKGFYLTFTGGTAGLELNLCGFYDGVLGVGSNPNL